MVSHDDMREWPLSVPEVGTIEIETPAKETDATEQCTGSGIAIGIALGVAFGAAIDNIGLGIALGIAIGAGIGSRIGGSREQQSSSDTISNESNGGTKRLLVLC